MTLATRVVIWREVFPVLWFQPQPIVPGVQIKPEVRSE